MRFQFSSQSRFSSIKERSTLGHFDLFNIWNFILPFCLYFICKVKYFLFTFLLLSLSRVLSGFGSFFFKSFRISSFCQEKVNYETGGQGGTTIIVWVL